MTEVQPPARILIVDDEVGVRALIVRWLRELGHEGREAATAEDAVATLARHPADIVLCDIALPDRDGHWLAEHVRAHDPAIAIVMMTGHRTVVSALNSLQHGFADYLVKPFGRDRLGEAVARGLAWQRRRRGDGPPTAPLRRGAAG